MSDTGRTCLIENLDLVNDRPIDQPWIGEVVKAEVEGKPFVYITLAEQGTFRLEGKQADALVNALKFVGVEGGWS